MKTVTISCDLCSNKLSGDSMSSRGGYWQEHGMSNNFNSDKAKDAQTVCFYESGRVIRWTDEHGNMQFNIGNPMHNENIFWKDFEEIIKEFAGKMISNGTVRK